MLCPSLGPLQSLVVVAMSCLGPLHSLHHASLVVVAVSCLGPLQSLIVVTVLFVGPLQSLVVNLGSITRINHMGTDFFPITVTIMVYLTYSITII